jgi:hypothetical protein
MPPERGDGGIAPLTRDTDDLEVDAERAVVHGGRRERI